MSLRALAREHALPPSTLRDRARREDWTQKREARRALPPSVRDAGGAEAIYRLTDKLVRRAEALLDSSEDINARELGELMRAVKSAKEIKMLRSALDEREQAARVKALEDKGAAEDKTLRIEFGPGTEEAAR